MFRLIVLLAFTSALLACAFYPKTVTVYDVDCQIYVRQMELEASEIMQLSACSDEGCIGSILGVGFISATTAVVSGSIVIVGNVVYWFEKQESCRMLDESQVSQKS